jgi:hypothetical protein
VTPASHDGAGRPAAGPATPKLLLPTLASGGATVLVIGGAFVTYGHGVRDAPEDVLNPIEAAAFLWPLSLVVALVLTVTLRAWKVRHSWIVTVPWTLTCMYYVVVPVHEPGRADDVGLVCSGALVAWSFLWTLSLRLPREAPVDR